MSCVVAMRKLNEQNQTIEVGVVADSCASNWSEQGTIRHSKIWMPNNADNIIMGLCGSIRELNILERATLVDVEKAPIETYDYNWVIENLVPNVMAALAENGAVNVEATQRYTMDSTILVATYCGLYTIQGDFSVVEYDKDYLAIGAGASVANGVISALEVYEIDDDIENILETALTAVADNTVGVETPINCLKFDFDISEYFEQEQQEELTEEEAFDLLNNLSENEQNEIVKLLKTLRKGEN